MDQKLQVLQGLDKGESVQSICQEFNVGKSRPTVNDWRQNRKLIETFCTQIETEKVLSTQWNLEKPNNELVDDALWLWFMQERQSCLLYTSRCV